mgnify:CR=1 FL=1
MCGGGRFSSETQIEVGRSKWRSREPLQNGAVEISGSRDGDGAVALTLQKKKMKEEEEEEEEERNRVTDTDTERERERERERESSQCPRSHLNGQWTLCTHTKHTLSVKHTHTTYI